MKALERLFAEKLLKVKAVKIQPANPFTWASGWKSPIYCDNRKTLSYPALRNFVKLEICRTILEKFSDADAIAGVATGAIAQGALVAEELNLPFVYVRSSPKDHGLENLIEGELRPGMKVVVVEDLISTGGSSLKAVEAIRRDGCEVIGMIASFTYGFDVSVEAFKNAKVELVTLTNYNAVLEAALKTDYIKEEDIPVLQAWRSCVSFVPVMPIVRVISLKASSCAVSVMFVIVCGNNHRNILTGGTVRIFSVSCGNQIVLIGDFCHTGICNDFQTDAADQPLRGPVFSAGQRNKVHIELPVIIPKTDIRGTDTGTQQCTAFHQFEELAVVSDLILHSVHEAVLITVRTAQGEYHRNDITLLDLFRILAVHSQLKEILP